MKILGRATLAHRVVRSVVVNTFILSFMYFVFRNSNTPEKSKLWRPKVSGHVKKK